MKQGAAMWAIWLLFAHFLVLNHLHYLGQGSLSRNNFTCGLMRLFFLSTSCPSWKSSSNSNTHGGGFIDSSAHHVSHIKDPLNITRLLSKHVFFRSEAGPWSLRWRLLLRPPQQVPEQPHGWPALPSWRATERRQRRRRCEFHAVPKWDDRLVETSIHRPDQLLISYLIHT